jgi:hypothetical protein
VIRQAYNWFVGNTSTTAGYDATLPFQGDTITAYNPSTQFERGLLTADLLDSRDCKWKDNSNVIPSNSFSSFSLVDEHSRYSVPDDNIFYSRKEINADDFTVTAIKNTTTQLPTTYFSLIPSIKSPSTNFAFKIHLTIPSTGSQLSVNDVVDVAINYKTPNEKDLYSATQGGADIDSAHFAVQFKFVNA